MNLLNKIRFVLTIDCRRASQLLSDQSERPLAGYERGALKFHLFLCGPCKKYARFLTLFHLALPGRAAAGEEVTLSPEAKSRIQRRITAE